MPARKPTAKTSREDAQQLREDRGRAFGAWLRASMVNPVTGERISNLQLAGMIDRQPSYIDVLTNDCFDRYAERVKLPGEEVIDEIAKALKADANEGRRAAGRPLLPGPDDPVDDLDALKYIKDPEMAQVVRYFHGLPKEMRQAATEVLRGMANAGDVARKINERNTIGKRADREDVPSSEGDSDSDEDGTANQAEA